MEQIGIGDTLLGKYRIESVLGRGGYGVVFRATTIATGRPVAVKALVVQDNVRDQARGTRFLREMKVIANLSSPYTVTLFDSGWSDNGVPFMVCELVEGVDLKSLLESRQLTEREAMHILWQVLRSLAEAHERGVLHRDIKPANIMIHEYGNDPLRVKVLDFGLAKSMEGEASLTASGTVVGTPRYMSPEQIFDGPMTPAVDVYAAGLVAYDMLVGIHKSRELPAGRPRTIAEDDEGLSPETREIVNRMLAVDPKERFSDAAEVLRAMAASRKPDPDVPLPTEEPARVPTVHEPASPPRTLIAASAGVIVGSMVTLAAVLIVAGDDEPRPPRAEARRTLPVQWSVDEEVDEPAEPAAPARLNGCGAAPPFVGLGTLERIDGLSVQRVLAHVPPEYDGSAEVGLIVLLHEAGSSPERFVELSGFAQPEQQHVLVAPEVVGTETPWSADQKDHVAQAITIATSALCIDPERVFLVGHGTGGDIARHAACDIPGLAAIATSASGRRTDAPQMCATAVPAIHLVGRDDGYNPIEGGENCSGVNKRAIEERDRLWRARNGCGEASSVWRREGESICRTWECGGAPLVSCVLDGGRGWPSSSPRLFDALNACDGKPASFPYRDVILQFFAEARE